MDDAGRLLLLDELTRQSRKESIRNAKCKMKKNWSELPFAFCLFLFGWS